MQAKYSLSNLPNLILRWGLRNNAAHVTKLIFLFIYCSLIQYIPNATSPPSLVKSNEQPRFVSLVLRLKDYKIKQTVTVFYLSDHSLMHSKFSIVFQVISDLGDNSLLESTKTQIKKISHLNLPKLIDLNRYMQVCFVLFFK